MASPGSDRRGDGFCRQRLLEVLHLWHLRSPHLGHLRWPGDVLAKRSGWWCEWMGGRSGFVGSHDTASWWSAGCGTLLLWLYPCDMWDLVWRLGTGYPSIPWLIVIFPIEMLFWDVLRCMPIFRHTMKLIYSLLIESTIMLHTGPYCITYITSSTAQGGGGSFKNRKPIGEVGCCESGMAERIHWWTERCLRSPTLSRSFSDYLPTYLPIIFYVPIYLSIYLSLSLSSNYLPIYLSI